RQDSSGKPAPPGARRRVVVMADVVIIVPVEAEHPWDDAAREPCPGCPGPAQGHDEVLHARETRLRGRGERALDRAGHVQRNASGRLDETGLHQGGQRVLVRLRPASALGELLRRAVLVAPRLPAVPGEGTEALQYPRD